MLKSINVYKKNIDYLNPKGMRKGFTLIEALIAIALM